MYLGKVNSIHKSSSSTPFTNPLHVSAGGCLWVSVCVWVRERGEGEKREGGIGGDGEGEKREERSEGVPSFVRELRSKVRGGEQRVRE